jgi:hypothetical protein
MGTNYYHRTNICKHCGRYDELHIGKLSAGWRFTFRGYRSDGLDIITYRDWLEILGPNPSIFDSYGRQVTLEEFKELVENSMKGVSHCEEMKKDSWYDIFKHQLWVDLDGYDFNEAEFS